jgi:hypothetical protein
MVIRTKMRDIDSRQTDSYKHYSKTLNESGILNLKTKWGIDSTKNTQNGYKRRGQERNDDYYYYAQTLRGAVTGWH